MTTPESACVHEIPETIVRERLMLESHHRLPPAPADGAAVARLLERSLPQPDFALPLGWMRAKLPHPVERFVVLKGKKIVVVMPAYNAAKALRQTYDEVMAQGVVDLVIVVDDASHDETPVLARTLPRTRDFRRSVRYGLGCLSTALTYRPARVGLVSSRLFPRDGAGIRRAA